MSIIRMRAYDFIPVNKALVVRMRVLQSMPLAQPHRSIHNCKLNLKRFSMTRCLCTGITNCLSTATRQGLSVFIVNGQLDNGFKTALYKYAEQGLGNLADGC